MKGEGALLTLFLIVALFAFALTIAPKLAEAFAAVMKPLL